MLSLLVALMLAQASACSSEGAALMTAASERARAFDMAGAAERLTSAAGRGCAEAELASVYLRGYVAAREAYRFGGSPESLEPVRAVMARLKAAAQGTAALPGIAAFVLQAAAAASQSERDELALVIEHAVQLEAVRLSAGLSGAPMITAHEAAGDLWLQVHRYEDARRAYVRAAERIGATPRVTLGLARTAARLGDMAAACTQYRALVTSWKEAAAEPREILRSPRVPSSASLSSAGGIASMTAYRYRAAVLEQLWRHGVQPMPSTRPELVHEFVSDLYRFELRRLRDRLVRKEIPKVGYYDRVVELRRRYPLVSVKAAEWLE